MPFLGYMDVDTDRINSWTSIPTMDNRDETPLESNSTRKKRSEPEVELSILPSMNNSELNPRSNTGNESMVIMLYADPEDSDMNWDFEKTLWGGSTFDNDTSPDMDADLEESDMNWDFGNTFWGDPPSEDYTLPDMEFSWGLGEGNDSFPTLWADPFGPYPGNDTSPIIEKLYGEKDDFDWEMPDWEDIPLYMNYTEYYPGVNDPGANHNFFNIPGSPWGSEYEGPRDSGPEYQMSSTLEDIWNNMAHAAGSVLDQRLLDESSTMMQEAVRNLTKDTGPLLSNYGDEVLTLG